MPLSEHTMQQLLLIGRLCCTKKGRQHWQGVTFTNDSVSISPDFEAMYDASCALWSRVRLVFDLGFSASCHPLSHREMCQAKLRFPVQAWKTMAQNSPATFLVSCEGGTP